MDATYPVDAEPRDIISIVNHLEPTHRAREEWQYGNAFYELSAHIIETFSGTMYPDFVTEKILHPLDMRHSYFGTPPSGSQLATPYIAAPDLPPQKCGFCFQNTPSNWIGHAAGGMLCTAEDFAKWLSYLLRLANNTLIPEDPLIIQPKTFQNITRGRIATPSIPITDADAIGPPASEYALGVWTNRYGDHDIIYHTGSFLQPAEQHNIDVHRRQRCRCQLDRCAGSGLAGQPGRRYLCRKCSIECNTGCRETVAR